MSRMERSPWKQLRSEGQLSANSLWRIRDGMRPDCIPATGPLMVVQDTPSSRRESRDQPSELQIRSSNVIVLLVEMSLRPHPRLSHDSFTSEMKFVETCRCRRKVASEKVQGHDLLGNWMMPNPINTVSCCFRRFLVVPSMCFCAAGLRQPKLGQ